MNNLPEQIELKIVIKTERVLANLQEAANDFNFRVNVTPENFNDFIEKLKRDVVEVSFDNPDFFWDGINNDCYLHFLEDDED